MVAFKKSEHERLKALLADLELRTSELRARLNTNGDLKSYVVFVLCSVFVLYVVFVYYVVLCVCGWVVWLCMFCLLNPRILRPVN